MYNQLWDIYTYICIYIYIYYIILAILYFIILFYFILYIYVGKFHHDRSLFARGRLEEGGELIRGIIPKGPHNLPRLRVSYGIDR